MAYIIDSKRVQRALDIPDRECGVDNIIHWVISGGVEMGGSSFRAAEHELR